MVLTLIAMLSIRPAGPRRELVFYEHFRDITYFPTSENGPVSY